MFVQFLIKYPLKLVSIILNCLLHVELHLTAFSNHHKFRFYIDKGYFSMKHIGNSSLCPFEIITHGLMKFRN